jgi:phosphoribosylformimino-5-aminoimidazole carboxamide ribotide isomerase
VGHAEEAINAGVRHILVLELAQVGSDGGTGTEGLCTRLAREASHLELTAGGGVRGRDDVVRLRDAGVHNVLVASALHDGRLTRLDCDSIHSAKR